MMACCTCQPGTIFPALHISCILLVSNKMRTKYKRSDAGLDAGFQCIKSPIACHVHALLWYICCSKQSPNKHAGVQGVCRHQGTSGGKLDSACQLLGNLQ